MLTAQRNQSHSTVARFSRTHLDFVHAPRPILDFASIDVFAPKNAISRPKAVSISVLYDEQNMQLRHVQKTVSVFGERDDDVVHRFAVHLPIDEEVETIYGFVRTKQYFF